MFDRVRLGSLGWCCWVPLCAGVLLCGCGRRIAEAPPPRDWELKEGTKLSLPLSGDFPRLGLQWTYLLRSEGYPDEPSLPPRLAFRVTDRDLEGHPWAGWWLYQGVLVAERTGFTVGPGEVFFHPPRGVALRDLEWAPWPVANPGQPGTSHRWRRLGVGWGADTGKRIEYVLRDVGTRAVEVPAGRFGKAWLVEGETSKWTGRFWWVDRVGFVRMQFLSKEGRSLDLALLDMRQISE